MSDLSQVCAIYRACLMKSLVDESLCLHVIPLMYFR